MSDISISKNKSLQEKIRAESFCLGIKFHSQHVGKFKNSIYHWTTDLDFWYTGANLGIKKGGGTQFSIIRGFNASHPTSQGYKKSNIKFW